MSAAVLPGGRVVNDHAKVSGLRSTSLDPLPSSVTSCPTMTACAGPALATGGEFCVVMLTVSAMLDAAPSLTINCATYAPGRSTRKVGMTAVAELSDATLPGGMVVSD